MPSQGTCTNDQKVPVTIQATTDSGRPANIDGALTVTVRPGGGDGTVEQNPAEPMKFFAVSGDAPGDTVYEITADADLGAGRVEILDTFTLTVTSATARAFGFAVGAPEPKAATPVTP